MSFRHAVEMELAMTEARHSICIPLGLDKLFRLRNVPEAAYQVAAEGRRNGWRDFDQKIGRVVFGGDVVPVPVVNQSEYTLFQDHVPERLQVEDLDRWSNLLATARSYSLPTLIHVAESHVEPIIPLPDNRWSRLQYAFQIHPELRSPEAVPPPALTTEELWFDEAHAFADGSRAAIVFPPEPVY